MFRKLKSVVLFLKIITTLVLSRPLLRTFTGILPCPPLKNSYARYFKGKHGKLYIVGKVNKCRFREKNELPVFLIPQTKIGTMTAKMVMRHSIKQMN